MKNTLALSALALAAALAIQPTFADDVPAPAVDASSAISSSAVSSEASSAMSSEPSGATSEPSSAVSSASSEPGTDTGEDSFARLMFAFEAMESSSDLAGVEDDENVDFILLSELDLQGRETELEDALERNQANIDLLRTDLASHPNLVTQITGAGHAVEDVVAIVVERQGSSEVIIFLDDRA